MNIIAFSKLRPLARILTVILPLAGCSGDGPTDTGNNVAELNFFEEDLAGVWYRFHAFDGSDRYIRFNVDRTACKWEEPAGSSSRISKSSYSNWQIDENDPAEKMAIVIQGAGITWYFDYPDNEIWPSGFRSNLTRRPSSSSKVCED